jgi:C1A family cysteine protease
MTQKLGYLRDDFKTYKTIRIEEPFEGTNDLPKSVNLVKKYQKILNFESQFEQKDLSSCTAQCICYVLVFNQIKNFDKLMTMPSRLFLYYNQRKIENNIDSDIGAKLCSGMYILNTIGVCDESQFPYNTKNFATCPSDECYEYAKQNINQECYKLVYEPDNLVQKIKSLLNLNICIIFGYNMYVSFNESTFLKTGIMKIPKDGEGHLGGHAGVIMGYDDRRSAFLIKNSWSVKWGIQPYLFSSDPLQTKSYFWMPYQYLQSYNKNYGTNCDDFWIVGKVDEKLNKNIIYNELG